MTVVVGYCRLLVFYFLSFIFAPLSGESVHDYQCSRTYLGRLGQGYITSYNYPFDYHDNLTCIYRIYLATNKPNSSQTVCLTFHRFSLENSSPFCSFDYLELGPNPPVKYCGTGLWQYGVEEKGNLFSNIWSRNLCWTVKNSESLDLVFSSDNSINGTGFYAVYNIYASSQIATSSFLLDESLDHGPCKVNEWTCFNRKCISVSQLCDGENDCDDESDESYAHARCKGQNVFTCDFSSDSTSVDGFCEFTHDGWTRSSELKTPRGPKGDHTNTTNGFYIYSESKTYLISPQLSLPFNRSYCLSFWYYIYGQPISSSLYVYISRDQAYSRPEWSRQFTREPVSESWIMGQVYMNLRHPLQVIFAADTENNVSGIALDDISVLEGDCSGVDISCNFESGMCGWTTMSRLSHARGSLSADHHWTVCSQPVDGTGPKWDHSSSDGNGFYLFVSFTSSSRDSRSILLSPAVSFLPGDQMCLRFFYYMIGHSRTTTMVCRLSVMLHRHDDVLSDEVWNQYADEEEAWRQANVLIEAEGPLQVILVATSGFGRNNKCEIAVDQIQFDNTRCTEGVNICDTGQYHCSNGQCIDASMVCDRVADCSDESDEDWRAGCQSFVLDLSTTPGVVNTNATCSALTSFLCHSTSVCIPRGWLCDMFNDCGDMSDEGLMAGCPVEGLAPTIASAVPMNTSSSSMSTTAATTTCGFACSKDLCIHSSKRCDGLRDCIDGLDELNCTVLLVPPLMSCQAPSMLCTSEQKCLSPDLLCNSMYDCSDGSDETIKECSEKLSVGAIAGIAFGCCLTLFLFLVVVLFARKRQKRCPVHQVRRPRCPPTNISTVFSMDNPATVSRHVATLDLYVGRIIDAEHQRERIRDNMGFIDEINRENSRQEFLPESRLIFGEEAPPSYNSVLQETKSIEDGRDRRRMLMRGNSADELEVPSTNTTEDCSDVSANQELLTRHPRSRRSYRSLPPTPGRLPLVPSGGVANNCNQDQCSSVIGRTANSEHIYEDPLILRNAAHPHPHPHLTSPLMLNHSHDESYHLNSLISPTLSSRRASRIRLGTTALQNRSGGSNHGAYFTSRMTADCSPENVFFLPPRHISNYNELSTLNQYGSICGSNTTLSILPDEHERHPLSNDTSSSPAPSFDSQHFQSSGQNGIHRSHSSKRATYKARSPLCVSMAFQHDPISLNNANQVQRAHTVNRRRNHALEGDVHYLNGQTRTSSNNRKELLVNREIGQDYSNAIRRHHNPNFSCSSEIRENNSKHNILNEQHVPDGFQQQNIRRSSLYDGVYPSSLLPAAILVGYTPNCDEVEFFPT